MRLRETIPPSRPTRPKVLLTPILQPPPPNSFLSPPVSPAFPSSRCLTPRASPHRSPLGLRLTVRSHPLTRRWRHFSLVGKKTSLMHPRCDATPCIFTEPPTCFKFTPQSPPLSPQESDRTEADFVDDDDVIEAPRRAGGSGPSGRASATAPAGGSLASHAAAVPSPPVASSRPATLPPAVDEDETPSIKVVARKSKSGQSASQQAAAPAPIAKSPTFEPSGGALD